AIRQQLGTAIAMQALIRPFGVVISADQIVLDTTARDRPDHRPILFQSHDGALWTGGRTPGLHNRDQNGVTSLCAPLLQLAQYPDIQALHMCLLSFLYLLEY